MLNPTKSPGSAHREADELTQLCCFRWSAPKQGYRWINGFPSVLGSKIPKAVLSGAPQPKPIPSPFLIPCSSEAPKDDELDGALFRTFADLPETSDGIINFANNHGWLGAPVVVIPQSARRKGEPAEIQLGERYQDWLSEIRSMSRLVVLWEQLTRRPVERRRTFQQRIRSTHDAIIYEWLTENDMEQAVVASIFERPELFNFLRSAPEAGLRKHEQILRFYLQIAVNDKLTTHDIVARLLWDRGFEKLDLSIAPRNLIGFLWLQFARAIQGDAAFRRCEDCGKWFAVGGQSSRSDKRFCSGTCKARTHRAKKASESAD